MDYDDYLKLISTRNVGRYDVSRLFADPETFGAVVEDFADPFRTETPDVVAGIEALGFALGTGVAPIWTSDSSRSGKAGNSPSPSLTSSGRN